MSGKSSNQNKAKQVAVNVPAWYTNLEAVAISAQDPDNWGAEASTVSSFFEDGETLFLPKENFCVLGCSVIKYAGQEDCKALKTDGDGDPENGKKAVRKAKVPTLLFLGGKVLYRSARTAKIEGLLRTNLAKEGGPMGQFPFAFQGLTSGKEGEHIAGNKYQGTFLTGEKTSSTELPGIGNPGIRGIITFAEKAQAFAETHCVKVKVLEIAVTDRQTPVRVYRLDWARMNAEEKALRELLLNEDNAYRLK